MYVRTVHFREISTAVISYRQFDVSFLDTYTLCIEIDFCSIKYVVITVIPTPRSLMLMLQSNGVILTLHRNPISTNYVSNEASLRLRYKHRNMSPRFGVSSNYI